MSSVTCRQALQVNEHHRHRVHHHSTTGHHDIAKACKPLGSNAIDCEHQARALDSRRLHTEQMSVKASGYNLLRMKVRGESERPHQVAQRASPGGQSLTAVTMAMPGTISQHVVIDDAFDIWRKQHIEGYTWQQFEYSAVDILRLTQNAW